ncbi:hypothetical protein PHYC_02854 [Phycisphaerales bacterium]|nr:hypothetical protein PHYC_02854 [Phycisphaerales bacterium]
MTSPLRITPSPTPGGPESHALPPRDSVRSWLHVMTRMLDAPDKERQSVADELEGHLRERVRDLMLAGSSEPDATRQAIAELGDAASLARRYQEAIAPSKRRFIMHVVALGVATAAVGLSGVAFLSRSEEPPPRNQVETLEDGVTKRFIEHLTLQQSPEWQRLRVEAMMSQPQPALEHSAELVEAYRLGALFQAQGDGLRTKVFEPPQDEAMSRAGDVKMKIEKGMTWRSIVDRIVQAGQGMTVRWGTLDAAGVSADANVGLSGEVSLAQIIRTQNEEAGGELISLRLEEESDSLSLASTEWFDRHECTLVTYDLTPLVDRRAERTGPSDAGEAINDASQIVMSLVYPDAWKDNGGDLAEIQKFDAKLFIKAPRRFHPHIKWVLDELLAAPDSRQSSIETRTRTGVPTLSDIPLIGRLYSRERDATSDVGRGPVTVRGLEGGRIELRGDRGTIVADEAVLTPAGEATGSQRAMLEKLVLKAEGAVPITVKAQDGRITLSNGETLRVADVVEIELPDGWWVRDEWNRHVVPADAPEPGGRVVTFTVPNGRLFGVWRNSGITGDRHEICPPGTPPTTPTTPTPPTTQPAGDTLPAAKPK